MGNTNAKIESELASEDPETVVRGLQLFTKQLKGTDERFFQTANWKKLIELLAQVVLHFALLSSGKQQRRTEREKEALKREQKRVEVVLNWSACLIALCTSGSIPDSVRCAPTFQNAIQSNIFRAVLELAFMNQEHVRLSLLNVVPYLRDIVHPSTVPPALSHLAGPPINRSPASSSTDAESLSRPVLALLIRCMYQYTALCLENSALNTIVDAPNTSLDLRFGISDIEVHPQETSNSGAHNQTLHSRANSGEDTVNPNSATNTTTDRPKSLFGNVLNYLLDVVSPENNTSSLFDTATNENQQRTDTDIDASTGHHPLSGNSANDNVDSIGAQRQAPNVTSTEPSTSQQLQQQQQMSELELLLSRLEDVLLCSKYIDDTELLSVIYRMIINYENRPHCLSATLRTLGELLTEKPRLVEQLGKGISRLVIYKITTLRSPAYKDVFLLGFACFQLCISHFSDTELLLKSVQTVFTATSSTTDCIEQALESLLSYLKAATSVTYQENCSQLAITILNHYSSTYYSGLCGSRLRSLRKIFELCFDIILVVLGNTTAAEDEMCTDISPTAANDKKSKFKRKSKRDSKESPVAATSSSSSEEVRQKFNEQNLPLIELLARATVFYWDDLENRIVECVAVMHDKFRSQFIESYWPSILRNLLLCFNVEHMSQHRLILQNRLKATDTAIRAKSSLWSLIETAFEKHAELGAAQRDLKILQSVNQQQRSIRVLYRIVDNRSPVSTSAANNSNSASVTLFITTSLGEFEVPDVAEQLTQDLCSRLSFVEDRFTKLLATLTIRVVDKSVIERSLLLFSHQIESISSSVQCRYQYPLNETTPDADTSLCEVHTLENINQIAIRAHLNALNRSMVRIFTTQRDTVIHDLHHQLSEMQAQLTTLRSEKQQMAKQQEDTAEKLRASIRRMEDFQNSFSCSICLDSFLDNQPATIDCGHIFCYPCIHHLVTSNVASKVCPLCRHPIRRQIHKLKGLA